MKISILKLVLAVSLIFNLAVLSTIGYLRFVRRCHIASSPAPTMSASQHLFEKLSLQPGQIEQLRADAARFHAAINAKHLEVAAKRDELFHLMRQDVHDPNQLRSAVAELSKKQEEAEWMVTSHILHLKSMLNKEQQKKFMELIENAFRDGHQGCVQLPCR
jgi:Spy/CpxP family protein refolding chaperone